MSIVFQLNGILVPVSDHCMKRKILFIRRLKDSTQQDEKIFY